MKRFALCLLMAFGVPAAQAAYLYWQVSSPQTAAGDGRQISFDYASVWAVNGNEKVQLSLADSYGVTTDAQYAPQGTQAAVAINLDQLGDATAYAFFIELVTYQDETISVVGQSSNLAWADAVAQNYIDTSGVFAPLSAMTAWHGTGYSVPEPSSAVMFLLGLAGLALRRRRA